jgi:hypothetical protein
MASTYVMIASKKLPNEDGAYERQRSSASKSNTRPRAAQRVQGSAEGVQTRGAPDVESSRGSGTGPNVHLDIQIHIPAEATAEQIDQIFESMARHLYTK